MGNNQASPVSHRIVMLTMEQAMKQSATRFVAGEIVKGTVIELRNKEVLVDIGYKSEGVIPNNEFIEFDAVKLGSEIDVLIEKLENKEGTVVLSHETVSYTHLTLPTIYSV